MSVKQTKKVKAKKEIIDISKVSDRVLDEEIKRREAIRRSKQAGEDMRELAGYYKRRISCPILGKAYLPDGHHRSYWDKLGAIKTYDIAGIRLGERSSRGYEHSEISMEVTDAAYEALNIIIHRWDPLIKRFWETTKARFETIVTNVIKDPARIAAMVAYAGSHFCLNEKDATEKEIKYYNQMIEDFNQAVIDRFAEYTDDILIDALKRMNDDSMSFDSFSDKEDGSDILMIVLNERGHNYTLNRDKRLAEEESEDDDDDDDWSAFDDDDDDDD